MGFPLSTAGAEVLSSGIGFLGNLGGSIAGGLFGANQARKNRKFQERMYNQQVQDNINFWKMQQDYNLPSAQLERIRNAGLSPLLLYGEGGLSGNIASQAPQAAQAPHGAQANASSFNTRFDMANLALVEAQAKALEAQANRDNTQSDLTKSQTEGQDIFNWINDQTKNVQVALKYGDYDYVKQLIRESANRVFQSSFVNASEMAALSLQNSLAIRKMNLSEYEVGQNVLQGWEAVISGRISANAQMQSSFAQLRQAAIAAQLAPYQIGLLRQEAAKLSEDTAFLRESRGYRVNQEFYKMRLASKDVSWYDLLKETGISEQQSRSFLNKMDEEKTYQDYQYKDVEVLTQPINALVGFGAGMMYGGNAGRVKVSGFGR